VEEKSQKMVDGSENIYSPSAPKVDTSSVSYLNELGDILAYWAFFLNRSLL
jgi:hypothetical protein